MSSIEISVVGMSAVCIETLYGMSEGVSLFIMRNGSHTIRRMAEPKITNETTNRRTWSITDI